jgi:hypothetical protein
MKTDLTREQMMMIVERARYQRSIAAGDIIAGYLRKALSWLAKVDRQVPARIADVADGEAVRLSPDQLGNKASRGASAAPAATSQRSSDPGRGRPPAVTRNLAWTARWLQQRMDGFHTDRHPLAGKARTIAPCPGSGPTSAC